MIAHSVGGRPATPGPSSLQDGAPSPWLDRNWLYWIFKLKLQG